ncbi:MAG: hypothetical protein M1822_010003 [Bathelium mastoideum]|nr:MAG: hypothetical protein M1822_010003 [Bathelium mastoideum]
MAVLSKPYIFSLPHELRRRIFYLVLLPPPNLAEGDLSMKPPIKSSIAMREKKPVIEVMTPWEAEQFDQSPLKYQSYATSDTYQNAPHAPGPLTAAGYWGHEPTSRLLRVCKELQPDALEVLYGSFVYTLRMDWDLVYPEWKVKKELAMSRFIRMLNDGVRTNLLRHLNLTAHIVADKELAEDITTDRSHIMGGQLAKWTSMRSMLPAVKTITCAIYLGRCDTWEDVEEKDWDQEPVVDLVMRLVSIWKGIPALDIVVEEERALNVYDHDDDFASRVETICKGRVAARNWWIASDEQIDTR